MEDTGSLVSFDVWDALTELDPLGEQVSAVVSDDLGVCALRLPRESNLLSSPPSVLVSSFNPEVLAEDPRWHIWDMLSAFGNSENADYLSALLASGGESFALTVEGYTVPALKFTLDACRVVVGSTEPAAPVALGVTLMPVPAVAAVDWSVWRPAVQRVLQ